ncbi:SIR2 family protein [Salinarimonas sp.]|uniref:SIR2 family protein n=1 Tax=Salinarimonas sp. TaxID=2766526 RepID=UPI0032D942B1
MALEAALLNALNATNLVMLTGAGSSFCVRNEVAGKRKDMAAPSLVDLWKVAKDSIGDKSFKKVLEIIPGGDQLKEKEIELLLTKCKLYLELHGEKGAGFQEVLDFVSCAERAILRSVDFIDEESTLTAHQSLIRKLGRRGARKHRAKIFTTNYDLAFEYAARKQVFSIIDGFSTAAPPAYDRTNFDLDFVRRSDGDEFPDFIENVLHLYKLHGSVDWRRRGSEIYRSRETDGDPVLIYPRNSKFQESFEPPYLDLMASFQTALRRPDTALLVSGFSFSDSHIAHPVLAALESNLRFRIIVCDVSFVPWGKLDDATMEVFHEAQENDFFHKILALAQLGDHRITLINGRFEDFIDAIPDLMAQTEREELAGRIATMKVLS